MKKNLSSARSVYPNAFTDTGRRVTPSSNSARVTSAAVNATAPSGGAYPARNLRARATFAAIVDAAR